MEKRYDVFATAGVIIRDMDTTLKNGALKGFERRAVKMNIEKYLEDAVNPLAIVSDLIEDFCTEYEEEPLLTAHVDNLIKIEKLIYLDQDKLLIDMLRSAEMYIYYAYKRSGKNDDFSKSLKKYKDYLELDQKLTGGEQND